MVKKKWTAKCKQKNLGYHATEEGAAQAYDNYVKDGVAPEGTFSEFKGVSWDKSRGRWRAICKGKGLGYHATVEAAAQAYDNYVKDGVAPVKHRDGTSSLFKGVTWHKNSGKWRAACKGKHLGYHATEEAAVRAHDNYVEDGGDPVQRRERTAPQFKGVTWDKVRGKWYARCQGQYLGYHATEEAAALACDNYAKVGRCSLTVSKPC